MGDYTSIVALIRLLEQQNASVPVVIERLQALGLAFKEGRRESSGGMGQHEVTQLNDLDAAGGLEKFCSFFKPSNTQDVQAECCQVLGNIAALASCTGNIEMTADTFIRTQALDQLVGLLGSGNPDLQSKAVRVVYLLCQAQRVRDTLESSNGCNRLCELLLSPSISLKVSGLDALHECSVSTKYVDGRR